MTVFRDDTILFPLLCQHQGGGVSIQCRIGKGAERQVNLRQLQNGGEYGGLGDRGVDRGGLDDFGRVEEDGDTVALHGTAWEPEMVVFFESA